jgi:hypothetical protein
MKSFNYLILGIASLFLLSCEKTLNKEELRFVHHTLVERMVQEKFCEEFPDVVEQHMDEPFTNWAESRVVHVQHDVWDDLFSGNSLWAEVQNNEARKVNATNNILKGYTENVINHIEEVFLFLNEQAEKDIYATIGGINYLNNLYETFYYCQTYCDNYSVPDTMKIYYNKSYEPILEHFSNTQEMMGVWIPTMIQGLTGEINFNNVYDQAFGYYKDDSVNPLLYEENKYKIIDALVISYIGNYLRYNFDYAKISEKDGRILEYIAPKIDYIYHAYGSIDGNGNTIENDNVWAIGYDNQQAFMVTLINNEDNMRMVSEPIEYDVTLVGEGLDMIN